MGSSPSDSLDFLAELNNGESRALLDTIDSLRELQVGTLVPLPQIIVVGDQSTGKSSVLEAISRVRFPVDAKLCTRFATELVLRRSESTRVSVSIRYDQSSSSNTGKNQQQQPFQRTEFSVDALPDIIEEAKQRMGLVGGFVASSEHGSGPPPKRFTKDVLRIEIARPDVYPLTLVDLPGIFRNETADQAKEDISTVEQLIHGYMQQEKSIILAVVMATNQLANQDVIMWAKQHDPQRKRTVGVVTKPDLSHEDGVTRQFVDVVQGRDPTHKLGLGWYVLRNLSETQKRTVDGSSGSSVEDAFAERDRTESAFFHEASGWSSIPPAHRGVQNLRKALSKVLLEHIRTSLPGLVQTIEDERDARRDELSRLGRPKEDPDELRAYLYDIAKEFQRLAGDGVRGSYADVFFDDKEQQQDSTGSRKLRANLRKLNRAFYTVLQTKGATHLILTEPLLTTTNNSSGSLGFGKGTSSAAAATANISTPDYLRHLVAPYQDFPLPALVSQKQFEADLEVFAADNQGRSLPGVPSSDLAIDLFRRQSRPWQGIAQCHLGLVLRFAQSFVEDVFAHVVGGGGSSSSSSSSNNNDNESGGENRRTLAALLNAYADPFFVAKRAELEAKLDEVLRPYVRGNGLPLEAEFHASLSRTALLRFGERVVTVLERACPEVFEGGGGGGFGSSSSDKKGVTKEKMTLSIRAAADAQRKSEFATESVVDLMQTYYDMSHRTFTENVINLVVENCLVCDIPNVLTANMVFQMDQDTLRDLASESEDVVARRRQLNDEIRILEKGLAKCRMYKPRTTTVLPSPLPTRTPVPPLSSVFSKGSSNGTGTASAAGLFSKVAFPAATAVSQSSTPSPSPAPKSGSGLFSTSTAAATTATTATSANSGGLFSNATPVKNTSNSFASGTSSASFGSFNSGNTFGSPLPGTGGSTNPASGFGQWPFKTPGPNNNNGNATTTTFGTIQPLKWPWNYLGQEQVPPTAGIPAAECEHLEPETNGQGMVKMMNICFLPEYSKFSPEELRLRDDVHVQNVQVVST